MNKLITGTLAVGIAFAMSACGSDDKKTESTTAPAVTSADESTESTGAPAATVAAPDDSVSATENTPTDVTEATDMTEDPGPTFVFTPGDQIPGLSDPQSQVVNMLVQVLDQLGMSEALDTECIIGVVAQMSDADAQLIVDAGPNGDPTLSPAGQALQDDAEACFDDSAVTIPDISIPTT